VLNSKDFRVIDSLRPYRTQDAGLESTNFKKKPILDPVIRKSPDCQGVFGVGIRMGISATYHLTSSGKMILALWYFARLISVYDRKVKKNHHKNTKARKILTFTY
jgi:hypothetical protein